MAILAAAAGLADKLAFGLDGLADRFLVGDLRRADIGFDLEFAEHAVDDDVEMQFAHAGDQGLSGFLVGIGPEGRVFFSQLGEGNHHLVLAGLGFRLDGHLNDRFGEIHGFQDDRDDSRSQSVSPVVVSFRPTAAAMSPE